MDRSKLERQQQEHNAEPVLTQPECTTPDALDGQEGGPQESQKCQQGVAEPKGQEVTSSGEAQFGPVVPSRAPPMASEPSSRVGATALAPGQRRTQPHVVVQPRAEQQGKLQLSPMEWPMPGEFYPRNHRRNSQEPKSPPQQQQLVTKSPVAEQGSDDDCTVKCPQAETVQQPEQHIEVNTNSSTQESTHDGEVAGEINHNGEGAGAPEVLHDVKLENEDKSGDCSQKAESIEDSCEKKNTPSVACCAQSNVSVEPVNLCPKPSSSDQAIEDTGSSGASTPTLIPEDCRSDQGSSSESVTTVLAAQSGLPQIDLAAGGIFLPDKTVFAPNHWGTHTYPTSFSFDPSSYENFIGRVPNIPLPDNFPPSSTFVPRIAKKGLILRHDLPVHNNIPMYAVQPPYYVHAAQHSQINYCPVPPNQQWQTAQRWEPMMQPQQAVGHEDLSQLQQQNMMQGLQGVFLHQVPNTDHFPVQQQIHPMAQMVLLPPTTQQQHYSSVGHQTQRSQQGMFLNQIPITEPLAVPQEHTPVSQQSHVVVLPQGPPVSQHSVMVQYPPPGTNYRVPTSMQAMTPQQFPPALNHARLQLNHHQQLPSTQFQQASSQGSRAPHQFPPVPHQQLQQLRSQVPVNHAITDTTPQLNAIQSQQGLMQHRPPVSQHLPVPQHHLPVADQHNRAAVRDLPVHPSNVAVAEQNNVLPTTKETEERQAGAEEAQGLERPARPRRPWVEEVEAAMIFEQATVRSTDPAVSAISSIIPLQPDFSRPPPPIERMATALGVDQASKPQQHRAIEPSKPPQHHRANGAQWPEQYQVPPRMLNNHNGNKQWTNPPPLGIPSRRGRGGCYTTNIGQPMRGHGARFPGRSDSESVQRFSSGEHSHMNGHGPGSVPHSHISRNDTVPSTSVNCVPAEEHQETDSKDSQNEHCNSEVACEEQHDTNRDRHDMDQHNSHGINNRRENSVPFRNGHRPHRGGYSGRNT